MSNFSIVWLDLAGIVLIVISIIASYLRGFIRECLSVLSWVAAIFITIYYYPNIAHFLEPYIKEQLLRNWAAASILFIISIIIFTIISHLIAQLIRGSIFAKMDQFLGAFFGLAKGILIIAVIIILLEGIGFRSHPTWRESKLVNNIHPVSTYIKHLLPESWQKKLINDEEKSYNND